MEPKNSSQKYVDVDKEALRLDFVFEKGINFKDRIILITGPIESESSFNYLDAALTEMERDSKNPITIKINSPGGSVYEALAMIGRIEASKCPIITECYGHAMSAAGLLLAAGKERRIARRSWFMYHEISYGTYGSHAEIKEHVKQAERELKAWAESMADFSNMDKAFWIKIAKKNNYYLDAEQCLLHGVVDDII